tara:strand:+ start:8578 stop:8970 length:393 start_codon:yes stop_codon:yes gene_type:complete
MKKTILAIMVGLFCLSASAQISVMSNVTYPADEESWGVNNFTNNMGVGYQVTDKVMVGIQKNGDNYDYIGRYNFTNNIYLSAQMPAEDGSEDVILGVGFSMKVWNNLYVEPNYTRQEEEGAFNVGISYKL